MAHVLQNGFENDCFKNQFATSQLQTRASVSTSWNLSFQLCKMGLVILLTHHMAAEGSK